VTEELLLSICDLVSKGGSAERAAMKVRENIDLESLQQLSDWIMSSDDLKSPKSLFSACFTDRWTSRARVRWFSVDNKTQRTKAHGILVQSEVSAWRKKSWLCGELWILLPGVLCLFV